MIKYLAFDTETGGLDPAKASLLTAYFAVLDENLNCIEELNLEIKADEFEVYHVTGKALEINRINLSELQRTGITKDVARLKLFDLLKKHTANGEHLIPVGHNIVAFDLGFIFAHLMPKETWDNYVDYHALDTAIEANFMHLKKTLPANVGCSLSTLAKYFKLDMTRGALHTAKFDTVLCVGVLQEMLKV